MSQALGPLTACLEELQACLAERGSGTFHLSCDDGSMAAIELSSGIIETVTFRERRGDFAVEFLKSVKSASCNFRREPPRTARESELSKRAIRWLAGGDGNSARPSRESTAAGPAVGAHRRAIETISFAFLGLIAGVACERAFADCTDLKQVIDALASELPPNEAGNFRYEIAKATGVK